MAATTLSIVVLAAALTQSPATERAVPDDFHITLERDACFGECPVYKVTIDASGLVTFEGEKFVRATGRHTDRAPVSAVAALAATVARIGFFELRDQYRTIRNPDGTETIVTDLPTTYVTVRSGGRSKRIEDYIGAPQGLEELERQIDETARTKRWIRIDVPTLQQLVQDGWSPSLEERGELLRKALESDDVDVVKMLLELGADPNAFHGASPAPPLMFVRSGAAARFLIEAGASPFATTESGYSPLSRAAYVAPEIIEVLLNAGVPPDQPTDSDGRTALWQAACSGNIGAVKLLLAAGADPARQASGQSAIDCARSGRASAETFRRRSIVPGRRFYEEDFDGVIALLEQALARRK